MMPRSPSSPRREQGAATLVVVMVLFLVMALLAAYANRSLLFEQRVSGNFFRASASLEASEAGIEWTLAQLNGTAVDNTCKPVAEGGQRFSDRYLTIDPADRRITSTSEDAIGIVDCARDVATDAWVCRCPAATAANSARPAIVGGEQSPSFGVLLEGGPRGGTLSLLITGCTTSALEDCQDRNKAAERSKEQVSRNLLQAMVGLVSAVRSPPNTPLVVRGNVESTGAGLGLHNTDALANGMLAVLGGSWSGMVDGRLESVPGTSVAQTVVQTDRTLQGTADAEAVFKMFMGASSAKYQEHPALRRLSCNGDCAQAIETAYKAGQRMLWVDGPLTIGSNKVLGSINDPLLIVASGDVTLDGAFQLNGMLVSSGDVSWTNAGSAPSVINGIVLVGGAMVTGGRMDIVYQQAVADQLRNRMGSYVRVPGGWIDNL
ncbi:PilX N-terminal domain-containing pilus assembly protein [Roseateles sp. LYH14W]|uniref:PilX N-terminal domain-containing pilus assembly protein n=1 Tax=Pelomonas parva TaxID=3299032 RepID=A0ABW7F4C4_9BURK